MNMINRIQGIVAVMGVALGISGVSYAQSTAAPEQKQNIVVEEKIEQKQKAEVETKKRGAGEGIQVHGHWTIEVKDPDGTVKTHREFENSLVSASSGGGAALLADLLLGYAVNGGFQIGINEVPTGGGQLNLFVSSPNTSCSPANPCSNTLIAGLITNGLSLSGQVTSTQTNPIPSGSIENVFTNALMCANTASPTLPTTVTTASPAGCTSANTFLELTFASLSSGIPVAAGQTVQATVQITFQ